MTLTKKDLNNIQDLMEVVFDQKIEEKGLVTKDDIKHLPTKHQFYNKMDKVVGELKTTREEKTVSVGRVNELEDRVDNIESKLGLVSPA